MFLPLLLYVCCSVQIRQSGVFCCVCCLISWCTLSAIPRQLKTGIAVVQVTRLSSALSPTAAAAGAAAVLCCHSAQQKIHSKQTAVCAPRVKTDSCRWTSSNSSSANTAESLICSLPAELLQRLLLPILLPKRHYALYHKFLHLRSQRDSTWSSLCVLAGPLNGTNIFRQNQSIFHQRADTSEPVDKCHCVKACTVDVKWEINLSTEADERKILPKNLLFSVRQEYLISNHCW